VDGISESREKQNNPEFPDIKSKGVNIGRI
jgi:hypothetical protein